MQKQAKPDLSQVWLAAYQNSETAAPAPIQKQASPTYSNDAELGKQAAHEAMLHLDEMVKAATEDMFAEEQMKYAEAEWLGQLYAHGVWEGVTKAAAMDGVQLQKDKPETNQGGAPAGPGAPIGIAPASMGEGIAFLAANIAKKPVGQISTPQNMDGPNKIIAATGDGFNG